MMVVKKEDTTTAVETLQLRYASAVPKTNGACSAPATVPWCCSNRMAQRMGVLSIARPFLPAIAQPFFY
jgi:hypothetical protein